MSPVRCEIPYAEPNATPYAEPDAEPYVKAVREGAGQVSPGLLLSAPGLG
ncbi:hypothetical protein [Streptomyces cyaneofuscatus]